VKNPDPQPVRAGIGEPHKSTYVISVPVFLLVYVHENVVLGAGHPRSHSGCIVGGAQVMR
jgi:hypothetical protein